MFIFKFVQSIRKKGLLQTIRMIYLKLIPIQRTWFLYDCQFLHFFKRWLFQIYYTEYLEKIQISRLEKNLSNQWENFPNIEWFLIVHQSCCLDAIKSILNQRYQGWKLKIIFEIRKQELPDWIQKNSRITIIQKKENQSLASLLNQQIKKSQSDWIGFSSSDDLLAPSFFYEIVNVINQNFQIAAIYSDHQYQLTSGQIIPILPKPQFSYWTLLSHQYIGNVFAIHHQTLIDLGCFKARLTSPFYDLLLRLDKNLTQEKILCLNIPLWNRLLKAERRSPFWGEYPYGKIALQEHWKAEKVNVEVSQSNLFQSHQFSIHQMPLISIIIPFRDHWNLTKKAIDSILKKSTYHHFEILLIDNQSSIETQQKMIEYVKNYHQIKLLTYDDVFNFSAINNFAVEQAKGDYLVLLNNDVEVLSNHWLEKMLGYAQHQQIGAVGTKLYYPDFSIQHVGIALHLFGCAGHLLRFFKIKMMSIFH